jgi:hypothetical protein
MMSTAMRVRAGVILLAILTTDVGACTNAQDSNDAAPPTPSPTAAADCSKRTGAFSEAFGGLPQSMRVIPICVADVGPGLADIDVAAEFSSVATGEVRYINSPMHGEDELVILGVRVGTLKSGNGADFVARLMSRLGPEAASGTVKITGHTVQYINLASGGPRGYAYGQDRTVVVGYVRPTLDPPVHPLMPLEVNTAITEVIADNTVGPPAPNETGYIDRWPLARGNYTTPTDSGRVYFRTDGKSVTLFHCGIAPNGAMAGCDFDPPLDGTPEGTNQIVLDASGLHHKRSDTPTFTRPDVDIVRIGERVENGPAACTVTDQAPVACRIADNGSVIHSLMK